LVDVMAQRERQLSALPVDRKLVVDAVASIMREATDAGEMVPRKELRRRVEEKVGTQLNGHKNILYTLAVEATTASNKKTAAAEKRAAKKADKVAEKPQKPAPKAAPSDQPIPSPDPQVPTQALAATTASEKQKSRRAKKKEVAAVPNTADVVAPAPVAPVTPSAAANSDATVPKKRGRKPKRDAEGASVPVAPAVVASAPSATVAVPVTTLEAIMQRLASQDVRIDTLDTEVKKLRQAKIATTLDAVVRNL